MITIYKYVLEVGSDKLCLPKDAEFLSVAFQGENLCLWCKVDTSAQSEIRMFNIFGTGWEITEQMGTSRAFIGTAHTDSGLVFHVFERLN